METWHRDHISPFLLFTKTICRRRAEVCNASYLGETTSSASIIESKDIFSMWRLEILMKVRFIGEC